jgi:hypothetical protein
VVPGGAVRWLGLLLLLVVGCYHRHWRYVWDSERGQTCYFQCRSARDSCLRAFHNEVGNPCFQEEAQCMKACPDVRRVRD